MRTIRGGVRVASDSSDAIADATVALVEAVMQRNCLDPEEVEALLFTMTPDLTANIPPLVLAEKHILDVPCLCMAEPHWDGEMSRVIRMMAFVHRARNTPVQHVYLNGAAPTRP